MDSLFLKDIRVWTRIGVPDAERRKEQLLRVSIELWHATKKAAENDDVTASINYRNVVEEVQKLAGTERKTIERFAEDCASIILKKFKPSGGVKVTVTKKPDLPLTSASVTIVRP